MNDILLYLISPNFLMTAQMRRQMEKLFPEMPQVDFASFYALAPY